MSVLRSTSEQCSLVGVPSSASLAPSNDNIVDKCNLLGFLNNTSHVIFGALNDGNVFNPCPLVGVSSCARHTF